MAFECANAFFPLLFMQCSELRWSLPSSFINLHLKYVIFIYSQSFIHQLWLTPSWRISSFEYRYWRGHYSLFHFLDKCLWTTESGKCCSFPFEYKNRIYSSCITTPDKPRPWCATELFYDFNGLHWDFCKGNF